MTGDCCPHLNMWDGSQHQAETKKPKFFPEVTQKWSFWGRVFLSSALEWVRMLNHRYNTEWLSLEGASGGHLSPSREAEAGLPRAGCPNHVQMASKYLQQWRFYTLHGQAVLVTLTITRHFLMMSTSCAPVCVICKRWYLHHLISDLSSFSSVFTQSQD